MLLAALAVIRVTNESVTVSLSLPYGFDIEQVEGPTLRALDRVPAREWKIEPRRDRASDLFRGFQASFDRDELREAVEESGIAALRVSGVLRGGAGFEGSCPLPASLVGGGVMRRTDRRAIDASGEPKVD